MIDLHTHILPQMDDGSQSPQETLDMLESLRQQGITTVAATPHFHADKETPQAFLERRQEAVARILPADSNQPKLLLGAEVAYFSGIGYCKEIAPLQIGNTKLILLEMPFGTWSDRIVEDVCRIPQFLGLQPILAHVNRYHHRHQLPKYIDTFVDAGIYFQCNTDAFLSPKKQRWAFKLLKSGKIAFLGTDCHNMDDRQPNMAQARAVIEKKLGADFYTQFQENASALLNDL